MPRAPDPGAKNESARRGRSRGPMGRNGAPPPTSNLTSCERIHRSSTEAPPGDHRCLQSGHRLEKQQCAPCPNAIGRLRPAPARSLSIPTGPKRVLGRLSYLSAPCRAQVAAPRRRHHRSPRRGTAYVRRRGRRILQRTKDDLLEPETHGLGCTVRARPFLARAREERAIARAHVLRRRRPPTYGFAQEPGAAAWPA